MNMNDQMSRALIVNNKNKIRFEAIARINICSNMNNNSHVTIKVMTKERYMYKLYENLVAAPMVSFQTGWRL